MENSGLRFDPCTLKNDLNTHFKIKSYNKLNNLCEFIIIYPG